jgi:hypothetical protein
MGIEPISVYVGLATIQGNCTHRVFPEQDGAGERGARPG